MEFIALVIGLLVISLILDCKFGKGSVYKSVKHGIILHAVFLILGVLWDLLAISREFYIFPGSGLTGIHIGVMPLEELMFILIIPYSVLVLNKVVKKVIGNGR